MSTKLNRRQVILGAGGTSLVLPILPSLLSREARAQAATPPKHFVSFISRHGMFAEEWFPYLPSDFSGAPALYTKVPYRNRGTDFNDMFLSNLAKPALSTVLGNAFAGLQDKMLIIQGLSGVEQYSGHNYSCVLAGYKSLPDAGATDILGASIDHISAEKIAPNAQTPVLNLKLAPMSTSTFSYKKVANNFVCDTAFVDPLVVFKSFFATGDAAARAQRLADNKTVVDFLSAEIADITPKLSTDDKQRFAEHIQYLHDLEKRLSGNQSNICVVPPAPAAYIQYKNGRTLDPTLLNAYTRSMLDVAIAVLRCGFTSCINIDLDVSDFSAVKVLSGDYHGLCHDKALDEIGAVKNWHYQQVAYFVSQLSGIVADPTTGQSLLNAGLVAALSEISAIAHSRVDLAQCLFGTCGGYFEPGRCVSYYRKTAPVYGNRYAGRGYSQLLFTILDAFGITATDYQNSGGAIQNYYGNDTLYAADWNKKLPGMKAV